MNLFIESLVVGFYLLVLFSFVSLFIQNLYATLFIAAFIKHFLGYYLGIEQFYCQTKCKKKTKQRNVSIQSLCYWSLLEGIGITTIGYIVRPYIENTLSFVIVCGILTHLISEILGIHQRFCRNSCV